MRGWVGGGGGGVVLVVTECAFLSAFLSYYSLMRTRNVKVSQYH